MSKSKEASGQVHKYNEQTQEEKWQEKTSSRSQRLTVKKLKITFKEARDKLLIA